MTSEKQYLDISDKVYGVEEGKADKVVQKNQKFQSEDTTYQVLATEDNPTNGMQAMAVAPIVDGEPDTSQIVIAYAGRTPVI